MNPAIDKIRRYPFTFGAFIGLLVLVFITVIGNWFPRVDEAWHKHNRFVQSVWFTIGFLGVWVSRYWRWRHRAIFWVSIAVFLLLHTLGILSFATLVHPLNLQEWIILLAVESFAVVFYMAWLGR